MTLPSAAPTPQAITFRVTVTPMDEAQSSRTDNSQPLTATLTVDVTGPTVVAPIVLNTIGTGTVETAQVTFSEPITVATFTNADLTLTRDGQPVTLTGVTVATDPSGQATSNSALILGLRALTATPGAYVLTVNGAGIQDVLGNAGTGSQTVNLPSSPPRRTAWSGAGQITGPTHDVTITAIPQDPGNDGRINTQVVEFAGTIERPNRSTFTDTHLALTVQALQGGQVIGSVDFTATSPAGTLPPTSSCRTRPPSSGGSSGSGPTCSPPARTSRT